MDRKQELDRIKEKLRKLMAKEESARELGNQAEADAFASKINQLLIEYELEVSEIQGEARVHSVAEETVDCSELTARNESDWIRRLYSACSRSNFCLVLYQRENIYSCILIGDDTNREFVHYMVHQLVSKLRNLSRKEYSEYRLQGGNDKRNTFIRAFLKGACISIRERLNKDIKDQEMANSQVHGLVLAKDTALKEYIHKNHPLLGSANLRNGASADGFRRGQIAGRDVSINKGVHGKSGFGGQKLLG